MTVKLPPGVSLGKDGKPGETISDSTWPGEDESSSTYDERSEGEKTQPGDTVIEMRDGRPVMYTQPGKAANA
jgi:hypothetical protein